MRATEEEKGPSRGAQSRGGRGGARPLPSPPRRPGGRRGPVRPPRLALGPALSSAPGAGEGASGAGPRWGTGPESDGGRRPGAGVSVVRPRQPPARRRRRALAALSSLAAPRSVHAGPSSQSTPRAGWAEWGAGRLEGGAPAQQLPLPSRRPQTFTKRRVRPHQSPLIIVGWAAGGGRGSRAGRPGRWERLLRREREPGAAAAGGGRK